MGWGKCKYYARKPKSKIVRDIFYWLMVAGVVSVAATSPYFATNLFKAYRRWKKYPRRKIYDTFGYLRHRGLIETRVKDGQIYISLTVAGKEKAGYFQINDLEIKRPKTWDGKWRIVIFDIAELKKLHREAFRGKLKELGFYQLQKSVWLYPFDCETEIELLRDFFGLRENDLRLIVAEKIGRDKEIRDFFKI